MFTLFVFICCIIEEGYGTLAYGIKYYGSLLEFILNSSSMYMEEPIWLLWEIANNTGMTFIGDICDFITNTDILCWSPVLLDMVLVTMLIIAFSVITVVAVRKEIKSRKDGK